MSQKKMRLNKETPKTHLRSDKFSTFFNFFIPILIFAICFFVTSYFAHLGSDQHSDGILFKPALDVSNGKMLFGETFTQYGALTTLLQALAIKIFGPFLLTIRLQTAFFYSLASVLLWLIWKKFLPKILTFISIIIWILLAPYYIWPFIPWSSVYSLFFQLLSIYLLIQYFEKNNKYLLFFSGLMAALTFWCRQPVGIFLIFFTSISLLLLFLIKKFKPFNILIYYIGSISITLVFLAWLFVNNSLKDWFLQSFTYSYFWNGTYGGNSKILSSLFPGQGTLLWSILPISIFIVIATIFLKKQSNSDDSNKTILLNKNLNTKQITILILSITSIGSWLQYYPISCIRHTYWGSTPMIGLFIYLIWYLISLIFSKNTNNNLTKKIVVFIVFITIIFGKDIKTRMIIGTNRSIETTTLIDKPTIFKNIKFTQQEAYFYSAISYIIDTYLNAHPGTKIITTGIDAIPLTFTTKTENYDPIYVNWPLLKYVYPNHQTNMDQYIKNNHPLIINSITQTNETIIMPKNYCYLRDSNGNTINIFMAPCEN